MNSFSHLQPIDPNFQNQNNNQNFSEGFRGGQESMNQRAQFNFGQDNNQFNQSMSSSHAINSQNFSNNVAPVNQNAQMSQSNQSNFPQVNGTDAHLNSLKACFKQAANSITSLYKQSTFSYNIAYQQGRQDAFEEVYQWFMNQSLEQDSGDFKNVSKQSFFNFMQEKINKQSQDVVKSHEDNHAFIQTLMPPPPSRTMGSMNQIRSPIGAGSMMNEMQQQNFQNQSLNHLHGHTAAELIDMAANNAIQEEADTNGGLEVVKKFNVNFGSLRLNDSKKRIRGVTSQGNLGGNIFGSNNQNMSDLQHYNHNNEMQQNNSDDMEMSISGTSNQMSGNNQEFNDPNKKIIKAKRNKPQ
eukprot:403370382